MRIIFGVLIAAALLVRAADSPETVAAKAAESWLAFVDTGDYGQSWEQASSYFKKAITKELWAETLTKGRKTAGKLQSRKLARTQAMKDPPNAPAGDYVLCQFESDFDAKTGAVETVVMTLEDDKQWRTSGYFMK